MRAKQNIFFIISLLYIALLAVPIFADLMRIPIQIICLLTSIILALLFPKVILKRDIIWFGIYILILFLYTLVGHSLGNLGIGEIAGSKKVIIEAAFIFPALMICNILQYINKDDLTKKIGKISLIIIALSFLYIVPLLSANQNILRMQLNADNFNMEKTIGLPGYTLMHAYIFMLPPLFYQIQQRKGKNKIWIIATLLLTLYIILNCYITTNIILAISIIGFTIIYGDMLTMKSVIILLVTITIILIFHYSGTFLALFEWLENVFAGTAVEPKVIDFKNLYLTGNADGGTIAGRENLHAISWDSFFRNILIGGGTVGAHSSIVDRLGALGLLGFIPYAMIFITQFKEWKKRMTAPASRMYYYVGCVAALVLLYQKGLFGSEGLLFLFVLLPCWIKMAEQPQQ